MRRAALATTIVAIVVLASVGVYYFSGVGAGQQSTTTGTRSVTSSSGSGSSTSGTSSFSTQSTSSTGIVSDWTTYHHDNSRTGNAGAVVVTSAKPGWVSLQLDGMVYAEPLAFDGKVFVATENDSVYALSAQTGAIVWRTHLGDPVSGSSLPCGNIDPSGITGTPVIDPATGTIYVVTFQPPANHSLVALNTSNGKIVFRHVADPPGSDPMVQQQRAALSLGNGMVYWLFGGLYGDCGQYHGWVVGLKSDGTGSMVSYQVPTNREGGIWASSGAIIDPSGDLFVATGNGDSTTTFDHGESVIKLTPSLQEIGYFAPTNWAQLNQNDADLGSVGPTFVGNGLIFQVGKEGVGYLLNATNLGGIGGQVFSGNVCSSFGGTAVSGSTVFVPCTDRLVAVGVTGSSFAIVWQGPSFAAGPPIVTGNVVWTLDVSSGTLHGLDLKTGNELYSLGTAQVTHFTTPTYSYGELFVAAGNAVYSFALGS